MALIKCKGCGHVVSDKGTKCPKCGTPIHKVEEAAKPIEEKVIELQKIKSDLAESIVSQDIGKLSKQDILNLLD